VLKLDYDYIDFSHTRNVSNKFPRRVATFPVCANLLHQVTYYHSLAQISSIRVHLLIPTSYLYYSRPASLARIGDIINELVNEDLCESAQLVESLHIRSSNKFYLFLIKS
jgi:hypothetical protein